MVYWFAAPAALAAVSAILRWIGVLAGIYMVGSYSRDIVTGVSTPVEISRDETIESILDDPGLTPEQRVALIESYIDKMGESDLDMIVNKLIIVVAIVAVAYLAATYIKK
ncbi:hypothetical protein KA005_65220 [bacterium]|nr:hypothetical protein [bacterium]